MEGNRDYDAKRFEALVLYIAWQTRNDPRFGRTKLAKVLFYSDFAAYAQEGKPLTGASYEHWKFGPFPPVLYDLEDSLQERKLARVDRLEGASEEGVESKIIPVREPDPSRHFEGWEMVFVDIWIKRVSAAGSKEISNLSHRHPGWLLTPERQEIPYDTAFIGRSRPPDEAVERAEELTRAFKWA